MESDLERRTTPPKAVLFDLGGTLLQETRLDIDTALAWLLESASPESARIVEVELRMLFSEMRQQLRRGIVEFPVLGFLKLALDWSGASVTSSWEDIELDFWNRLCSMKPLPGVKEALSTLRERNIITGVISNSIFTSPVLRYELERNDLLQDLQFVISSADYGFQKPHPAIFKAALARCNCLPDQAWFVGDNYEKDVRGAINAGMQAIWLTGEQGASAAPELLPGTVYVRDWKEFLSLVIA